MDIKTAEEMFGDNRLLIIGLIQFLINKKIICNQDDMNMYKEICLSVLHSIKDGLKDPVALIQIEKTEASLMHVFQSFRMN